MNNAASRGQKHHYIPSFYLKHWAGKDRRLCEFSRPYNEVKPRKTYPDGIGYERGLYTFDKVSPLVRDFLENQFLLRADDLANAALCRLVSGNLPPNAALQTAWSRFLMTLLHRTPEGIARVRQTVNSHISDNIEDFRPRYEALRTPDSPTFEEFRDGLSEADSQHIMLTVLRAVMDSKRVGTVLHSMQWRVLTIDPKPYPLLTSDRPLVINSGIGRPDGYILMPISPSCIFAAVKSEHSKLLVERLQTSGIVQRLNNKIVRQARKFVWGQDDTLLWFVAPRLGEKARSLPWE